MSKQTIEKAARGYAQNINPELYHHKLDIDWFITQLIKFAEQFKAQEQSKICGVDCGCTDVCKMNQPKAQEQKPVWVKATQHPRQNGRYFCKHILYKSEIKHVYEFKDGSWLDDGMQLKQSFYWLDEQSIQKPIGNGLEFAKWLEENTVVTKEEKITLYRYCDKNNEWGNYILDDIYQEYLDLGEHSEKEYTNRISVSEVLEILTENANACKNLVDEDKVRSAQDIVNETYEDLISIFSKYKQPQQPLTDKEIEALAEKEYPILETIKGSRVEGHILGYQQASKTGFIKGFKAALKLK